MSTLPSPISYQQHQNFTRKGERKMLARQLRLRDRRRKVDALQYRFRHVTSILASGFLAVTVLTIAKMTGLI